MILFLLILHASVLNNVTCITWISRVRKYSQVRTGVICKNPKQIKCD